jgi:hypothetical protein
VMCALTKRWHTGASRTPPGWPPVRAIRLETTGRSPVSGQRHRQRPA